MPELCVRRTDLCPLRLGFDFGAHPVEVVPEDPHFGGPYSTFHFPQPHCVSGPFQPWAWRIWRSVSPSRTSRERQPIISFLIHDERVLACRTFGVAPESLAFWAFHGFHLFYFGASTEAFCEPDSGW